MRSMERQRHLSRTPVSTGLFCEVRPGASLETPVVGRWCIPRPATVEPLTALSRHSRFAFPVNMIRQFYIQLLGKMLDSRGAR